MVDILPLYLIHMICPNPVLPPIANRGTARCTLDLLIRIILFFGAQAGGQNREFFDDFEIERDFFYFYGKIFFKINYYVLFYHNFLLLFRFFKNIFLWSQTYEIVYYPLF